MIRIGRATDSHVILYSAVVSRHHAELYRTTAGWVIKSLGTNGTYLDGRRIQDMAVDNGVVIRLARSGPNIQIHISENSGEPAPSPPANPELLDNSRDRVDPLDQG
ncbi:MAG: FHA domain-containing protein [Nodosilinea sp.]